MLCLRKICIILVLLGIGLCALPVVTSAAAEAFVRGVCYPYVEFQELDDAGQPGGCNQAVRC